MRASPTRIGKFFPLFLVLITVTAAGAFAEPIWMDVDSTPYDRQMARVRPVLASVAGETPETVQLAIVAQWMSRIRRLHYRYSREWQTPSEVMSSKTMKEKSILTHSKMRGQTPPHPRMTARVIPTILRCGSQGGFTHVK